MKRRHFLAISFMATGSLFARKPGLASIHQSDNVENEVYNFKVGNFRCTNFNTGYHNYKISSFFYNIPAENIQTELGLTHLPETIKSTYSCLLADNGIDRVLIDSGVGTLGGTKNLLQKYLIDNNIAPESINKIILTHAHPDHIGGLTNEAGDLCFPNAVYYSREIEWEFFKSDENFAKAKQNNPDFAMYKFSRDIYKKISPKLVFVEPESEITPGIKVIDAKGHTPGQLAVIIQDSSEKLIFITDVLVHPLNMKHPEWLPSKALMFNRDDFISTRNRIMNLAADENMLVSAMHFSPPPGLGHVKKTGSGWDWIQI